MRLFIPFIGFVTYCIILFPREMHSQSLHNNLRLIEGKSIRIHSEELYTSVQTMLLHQQDSESCACFDAEITNLTKKMLDKSMVSVGLRPFELRVDFIEELDRLQTNDISNYLCPSSLNPLIQPQPFTYNMAVAGWNRWWINPVEWIVVDVPDFYASDYNIQNAASDK